MISAIAITAATVARSATGAAAGAPAVPVRLTTAVSSVPVIVIVMENQSYAHILGNPQAPFINGTMIPGGVLDTNYFAAPGSLPDYLMMVSGQFAPPSSAPNLFATLGQATSWREYMESMPSPCYKTYNYGVVTGTKWGLYTKYHNPALQFTSVLNTPLCDNVVPLSAAYFDPAALPAFSYVVPNECDDMHTQPTNDLCPMWNGQVNVATNPVTMGDNWLASFVPLVAQQATVILTWDEASKANEHVVTVAYGAGVTPGTDSTAYSHASLEAGLYAYLGLGTAPGAGATATVLPIP